MNLPPLSLAGALLALSACMNSTPAPTAGMGPAPAASGYQNQVWELELVDGAVFSARPVRATAEFTGSTYRFSGACNCHSGNYAVGSGGALALMAGERTEIACGDALDAAFFALVDQASQLHVTRAGLVLVTAAGQELVFRPYS